MIYRYKTSNILSLTVKKLKKEEEIQQGNSHDLKLFSILLCPREDRLLHNSSWGV